MKNSIGSPLGWLCATIGAVALHVPQLTWLLVMLMLLDMAFGFGAAIFLKDLSAEEARKGAIRKLGHLGVVCLAGIIGRALELMGVVIPQVNFVQVATAFFIPYEVVSILKNAGIMGVPIPPEILGVMRYFQKDSTGNA